MNATIIGRLFWKEYRTQRGLWLAIIAIFLATAVATVALLPQQHQPDFGSMLMTGFMTVLFYLLASTSVLYASEKEQRTDILLRTLPLNKWLTLSVKIGWVLLSSLLAIGVFALASFILAEPGGNWFGESRSLFAVLGYVFVCALVATLLCNHVLSAIVLAIGVMILGPVLAGIIELYITSFQTLSQTAVISSYILVVFGVALELNRRWYRERDGRWSTGISLGRPLTLHDAVANPLEGTIAVRSWRRLFWKEWRSARVWIVGIMALLIGALFLFTSENTSVLILWKFSVLFIVVPVLFGIGSCRSDQTIERHMFLGNRGQSATKLILAKHFIWFSSCVLIVVIFSLVRIGMNSSASIERGDYVHGGLTLVPYSTILTTSRTELLSNSMIAALQYCAGMLMLMYSLGHLLSLLFKQSVLAISVSVIASSVLFFLAMYFYSALEVPLFVVAIAPSLCLYGLSFAWGENWLTGRGTLQDWKRFLLWSLLCTWSLITLLAAWRVAEVVWGTILDQTGLDNIATRYVLGIVIAAVFTWGVLVFADWLRRNLRDSSGRQLFGMSRWGTLGIAVATFLIGHNLLLTAGLIAYDSYLDGESAAAKLIVDNDLERFGETTDDPYKTIETKIDPAFRLTEIKEGQPAHWNSDHDHIRAIANFQWNSWKDVTAEQKAWYDENQHLLSEYLEADALGLVKSVSFATPKNQPSRSPQLAPDSFITRTYNLIFLSRLNALKLEQEGKLAEAWKYHLANVRYARLFATESFSTIRYEVLDWLITTMFNGDLWRWQARKEQTPELLARAAGELRDELEQLSPLAEAYERFGAWTLNHVDQIGLFGYFSQDQYQAAPPWEQERLRALLVEQTRISMALAHQVDRNEVSREMRPISGLENEIVYDFSKGLQQGDGSIIPVYLGTRHDVTINGLHPSVLVTESTPHNLNSSSSGSQTLPVADLSNFAETTPLLMYAPSTAGMLNQHLPITLRMELNFHSELCTWIGCCAIYSYRAETGAFSATLSQLNTAPHTTELFSSLYRNLKWGNSLSPQDLAYLVQSSILKTNPRHTHYNWFHASRWPQPEYNLGETPDVKPDSVLEESVIVPLEAPQPTQEQP